MTHAKPDSSTLCRGSAANSRTPEKSLWDARVFSKSWPHAVAQLLPCCGGDALAINHVELLALRGEESEAPPSFPQRRSVPQVPRGWEVLIYETAQRGHTHTP